MGSRNTARQGYKLFARWWVNVNVSVSPATVYFKTVRREQSAPERVRESVGASERRLRGDRTRK